jgi:hypothetical protein
LCALPKMCILIINYINDKNISRKKKDLWLLICAKKLGITFSKFTSYSPRNCAKSPTKDHQKKNGQRLLAAARRRQNRKMVDIFKNDFATSHIWSI